MARKRPLSRVKRWSNAVGNAREAFDAYVSALEDLKEIQGEFEGWKDNLPENFQSSALGEKLEAICDIDLEPPDSGPLDEAEGVELPLGFGRD